MTTTQWIIGLVIAFLGGGLAGAILNNIVTHYKNRIQPIVYSLDIIDIFQKGEDYPKLAELTVVEHPLGFGERRPVKNFSVARITITNQGNKDYDDFGFGITMGGDNKSSDIRFQGADRHHEIRISLPGFDINEEPKKPVTAIDFSMKPFNRRDTYEVDVYFTFEEDKGEFTFSSPHPVRFVEKGATSEMAKEITKRVIKEVARKSFPV